MTEEEFERVYGPLDPLSPGELRELLDGLDVPWWVAGGWAVEAFTGVRRHHEDIDVSVFRRDLGVVRAHLEPHFHLWAAGDSGLLHLARGRQMPEDAEQLWFRQNATSPWRGEVLLNPDLDGRWQFKRDPSVVLDLDDATWQLDGVRYLRPELVLAHKVRSTRAKDHADLAAALPLFDSAQRAFLANVVARQAPEHPWAEQLG